MPKQLEEDRSSLPSPLEEDDLIGWETVRDAVAGQSEATPSSSVERALLAKIRVREAEQLAPPPSWWTWAWGVAVALLVTIILWATLNPGLVVEWEAQTDTTVAFQLLRSSGGTEVFQTLQTFEANQSGERYQYVDLYVWPGQTYVYQVEAHADGRLIDERTLVVPGHVALPGQLAVVITGIMVGYEAVVLVRRASYLPHREQQSTRQ
jgi:hypothetical protein